MDYSIVEIDGASMQNLCKSNANRYLPFLERRERVNSTEYTFNFVFEIMHRLAQAQMATWLFGGWAEELWGLCYPRSHHDIDLLYPTTNFLQLDQWLANTQDLSDFPAKRFSHKRAILCKDIMIEVIMLEPVESGGYLTNFFNQRYQLVWPHDTLGLLFVGGQRFLWPAKKRFVCIAGSIT